jgi:hypothetical protein
MQWTRDGTTPARKQKTRKTHKMKVSELISEQVKTQACRGFYPYMKTRELKETLRSGKYTWPGAYPLFFITSDGAALSFEAVRENLRSVLWSMKNQVNDGWRVVQTEVNWEDGELYCEHTGERIESAYSEE